MFTRILSTAFLTFTLVVTATSALAVAPVLNNRSFVSTKGLDTNPCTPAAPCRLFSAAINMTNDGGEVVVLDSGGFGAPLNITKSITLIAPAGVHAGFAVSSGTAVTINTAGIKVTLRGLNFTNTGTGQYGVNILDAAGVSIENSTFTGFLTYPNAGVHVASGAKVAITDSTFTNNFIGVHADGNSKVLVNRSKLYDNNAGIVIGSTTASLTASADIIDTVISGSAGTGIYATTTYAAASSAYFNLGRVTSNDNGNSGITVEGINAAGIISRSELMGNPIDVNLIAGGVLTSVGNNVIGSVTGTLGNGTSLAK